MAHKTIFDKNSLILSHAATIFAIIGYFAYWVELYFIKLGKGTTSFLAWIIFIVYFLLAISFGKERLRYFLKNIFEFYRGITQSYKRFFILSCGLSFLILLVIFNASLLPPHLSQEYDSLNYHITIPRQHLILQSFAPINWSAADLFLLPLQFSLAPYWLVRELPTRFPQIVFVFGLLTVSASLTYSLSKNILSSFLVIFAIIGSHGLGIQMGVVMLDLIICYFFIAAVDSFLKRKIALSAIEFSFFILSKPFIFPQITITTLIFLVIYYMFNALRRAQICWGFDLSLDNVLSMPMFKKFIIYLFVMIILIGGPFILKSLNVAGTPLFPFAPGIIKVSNIDRLSLHWQSIKMASQIHITTKDQYGSRGSFLDFVKHLWILSIPEKGVNNRFDYPLGLPYLLFILPFFYLLVKSFKNKIFPILPLFVIIYWSTWWFLSQQSRFLYIPLALIFIVVSANLGKQLRILIFCLSISLALNFISIFRAHRNSFNKPVENILRDNDKKLLELGRDYYKKGKGGPVILDFSDAAYATFPIKVISTKTVDRRWVLAD